MEAKWVLTGDQKKIRFRKLIRKRKMKGAQTKQEAFAKLQKRGMTSNTEHLISLPPQIKNLVSQEDTNNIHVTQTSPCGTPATDTALKSSVQEFNLDELKANHNVSPSTFSAFAELPPLLDFRAKLLQLQDYADKTG